MIKNSKRLKEVVLFLLITFFFYGNTKGQTENKSFKKGHTFLVLKQYDSAYHYLNRSKKYYLKKDSIYKLAKTYISLSSLFAFKNIKDSSNYYVLESQELANKLKDKKLKASIYVNLAFQKYNLKDLKGALDYAHFAESIYLKEKDSTAIAMIYNNLAVIYRNTANWDKALTYNKKALQINTTRKDSIGIGLSLNNIGLVYSDMSKPDSAKVNFIKAIRHNENYGIENSNAYSSLGEYYQWEKNYTASNSYYKKALFIDKKNKIDRKITENYKQLLVNAIHLKDFNNALIYQKEIDYLEKKALIKTNNDKLKQLEDQQQLFLKEKELELTKSVSEKNKIIFLIVSGLLIITLLFFLQSYRTSKLKRQQERLLLERKVLRAQMNPHFIFNALSAIQNSLLNNDPLQSASYLSGFSKLIRQNFEFVNKDQIALSDDLDALKNYIETQQMRFNNSFDYVFKIAPELDIDLVKIPPMLLQPFVENSIEHGFKNKVEKGLVTINISQENKSIKVVISDNGIGFDTNLLNKGEHSFSVFKKRLRLLSKFSEKSFSITSSNLGTQVQFNLTVL